MNNHADQSVCVLKKIEFELRFRKSRVFKLVPEMTHSEAVAASNYISAKIKQLEEGFEK